MKIRRRSTRRNYIIIGLCMVLALMGVGYSAFSSLLTINGTANVQTNWCVGFDNTKTSTYQVTKGAGSGSNPNGTMTYSGTACSTNLQPNSSLTANFYQPGDQIEYTLTIKNASSLTAAIKSINVDGTDVTSNTTKKKENITYIINMPESTTLAPNASTTMTVIAKFQNDTPIGNGYTGESQSITVRINAEQDDGNGGFTPTPSSFSGSIYRWSGTKVNIGDSIAPVSGTKWCAESSEFGNSCDFGVYWESENECNQYLTDNSMEATCGQKTVTTGGIGEYTTDASTLNKTYYLKHDVVDDIITASYVCFVTDIEHCMQGGNSSYYAANKTLLQSQESWFTGQSGSCSFGDGSSSCSYSSLKANASSGDEVNATDYSWECIINSGGVSRCLEYLPGE